MSEIEPADGIESGIAKISQSQAIVRIEYLLAADLAFALARSGSAVMLLD